MTWTGSDRLATFTDADGVVDSYTYARSGLMLTHRRGPWTLQSRDYDSVGRIQSDVTDGIHSEYLYDSLGRATTVRQGVSGGVPTAIEQLTYTARDQVATHSLSPVAGGAALTIYTYNALGWLTSEVRPTGTTSYTHDLLGRRRSVTDGEGYKRSRTYDSRGRITSFELPGRGKLTVGYTVPATYGNVGGLSMKSVTDEELNQSKTWTDAIGRTIATQHPDSTSIVNSWSGSRLTTQAWLSAAGTTLRERRHQYDAEGRTSAILGPATPAEFAGAVYSMGVTYSSAGRVLTTTVPDETTTFTYANGLLATEKYQNLMRTLRRTDPNHSWVVSEDLQQGAAGTVRRRTYARDALGRLLSETITNGTGVTEVNAKSGLDAFGHPATELSTLNGIVQVQHNWTFDQRGRPTQRITATAGVPNLITRWSWYRNDVLKTVSNPSGVALGFDYGTPFDQKLRAVYDANVPATQTQHAVFDAWNGRGMPTHLKVKPSNSDVNLAYDSRGRLTSKQVTLAGAPIMTWSAVRDDLGKLISETIKPAGVGRTNSYGYDSFGRLTSEVRGKTGESIAYAYGLAGNRTRKQITHTTGAIETATASYSGSRLNTYQASAGGPIISIPYDAWGGALADTRGNTFTRTPGGKELTIKGALGASPIVTIARDAAGLPVRMSEGGELPRVTIWDLDPGKMPLEVRQSDGTVLDYVTGMGFLLGRFENGLPDFDEEHTGPQGSVLRFEGAMLDDATAFGDGVIQPAGTDERLLFAGLELVPSAPGVLLARQRAYDPGSRSATSAWGRPGTAASIRADQARR